MVSKYIHYLGIPLCVAKGDNHLPGLPVFQSKAFFNVNLQRLELSLT